MPTFSAIELENLVEPRVVRDSYKKPLNVSPPRQPRGVQERETALAQPPPSRRHIYISPALYATPEPAPIPQMATEPSSPSPYVVNHKRRGGGSRAFGNRRSNSDGFEVAAGEQGEMEKQGADLIEEAAVAREVAGDNFSCGGENELFAHEEASEAERFLDARRESASVGSENEVSRQYDCRSFVSSTHGEFFDAIEDFSSDSAVSNTPLYGQNSESELRDMRLSLLEEIEKRKDAEDALNSMRVQWQRIRDLLSEVGIKLPIISESSEEGIQLGDASVEDLSQELIVRRYVAHALGKAEARVEAELAAETILQSKDQEISRLRDRLQYYEAVNREMSQRNQEIIEVARKQRHRRQSRWFWSCIGASAAIGISVLAYAYTSKHQDVPSPNNSNISSSRAD